VEELVAGEVADVVLTPHAQHVVERSGEVGDRRDVRLVRAGLVADVLHRAPDLTQKLLERRHEARVGSRRARIRIRPVVVRPVV
jgi:hypothetical protein